MKHHRLGAGNNRHVLLLVLESGKSEIMVLACLDGTGEASLLSLQIAAFLLGSHMAAREMISDFSSIGR